MHHLFPPDSPLVKIFLTFFVHFWEHPPNRKIKLMIVKISDIKTGKRKRSLDNSKVQELAESIKAVGLLNPVTLNVNNELISGLHRIEAYKLLGYDKIEATKKDFKAIKKELAQIDENLIRKELSALEAAEFLVKRDELLDALGLRAKAGDNQHTLKDSAPKTTKQIAKEIGIAERTAQLKKQIVKNLSGTTKDKIRNTEIANNNTALLEISKLPPRQQLKVANKLTGTEDKDKIKRAINQVKREKSITEALRKAKAFKGVDGIQFLSGDFRDVSKTITDNSIDAIFTDPPYPKEFLPLWKDLAETAYRVLKPSGFIVTHTGTHCIPNIMNYFTEAGLEYYWLSVIAYKGNRSPIDHNKNVRQFIRPILIFCKPPAKKPRVPFNDLIKCEDDVEKDLHPWQQTISPVQYLIRMFTEPNDLILEPFSCSGTTAIAALMEKRRCIGIELDDKMTQVAKGRIQDYLENGYKEAA